MEQQVHLSTFWLAIPDYIRSGIVLLALLLLLRPIVKRIMRWFFLSLAWLSPKGLHMALIPFDLLMTWTYRLFGSRLNRRMFEQWDRFTTGSLKSTGRLLPSAKLRLNRADFVRKAMLTTSISLPLLLLMGIYLYPNSAAAERWNSIESSAFKKLGIHPITDHEARLAIQAWMKDKQSEAKDNDGGGKATPGQREQWLILKPEYTGGNIRSEPHLKGKVVKTFYPQEPLLYMNESDTDSRNQMWYKVQTEAGDTGWVSGSILMLKEK